MAEEENYQKQEDPRRQEKLFAEFNREQGEAMGMATKGREVPSDETDITDAEIDSIQPGKAHPMDPDFIFILSIAMFNDLLIDPLFDLVGFITVALPIIRRIIDVFVAAIIMLWIYWKSKNFVMPEQLNKKIQGMEKNVAAKIQAKIQKKIASKAIRRALIRGVAAFGIEEIPGVSLFTSWTVAVLSML
jgi:hypothetical protein